MQLLEAGADASYNNPVPSTSLPGHCHPNFGTALHEAACVGNGRLMAEMLLEHGANPWVANMWV